MNPSHQFPFTNLVFEGGGVKGIAYAGALKILEEKNVLSGIARVAGTSAGAISATLVSIRCSAAEVETIVNNTNFASFEDHKGILHIPTKYGLYKGQAFLDWMKKILQKKGIPSDVTFKDFVDKYNCLDLHVFATDLNTHSVREFSRRSTPNAFVAQAVRASMSIPLFFEAFQFSNKIPDDHIYVDGGTVYNYPITAFDEGGELNENTLGLHLDNLQQIVHPDDGLEYDHLLKYVKNLFTTLLKSQVIDFQRNKEQISQSIRIDDHGISATDFKLNAAQKQLLFDAGCKAATEYLANYENIHS